MVKTNLKIFLLLCFLAVGCSSKHLTRSSMIPAVRWAKSSAEYKALTMQTYQTAELQLNKLLQDSTETASLE